MSNPHTVYLDYAAATPLDERVFVAMQPYFSEQFYNPSSPYAAALKVKRAVREAKQILVSVIGAKADEIVMTAGATESVNLAIRGVMQRYPKKHLVTSSIEHAAVLESARLFDATIVPAQSNGLVSVEQLKTAITDATVLVSIGYANSELGTVQHVREIAKLVEEIRQKRLQNNDTTPLYLHSDASQAAGYLDLTVSRLGVDLFTLNAGKCYGPKQAGLLWVRSGLQLTPLVAGGGQEHALRSGTENVPAIIGFATALQLAETERKTEVQRLRTLRDTLQAKLEKALPKTVVNGHQKRRLPGHLHVSWAGVDAERVLYGLDMRGIMVATGSACAANKGTRSHVLEAIGLKPEVADGSIRITLGRSTTEEDITYAADCIIAVVTKELAS